MLAIIQGGRGGHISLEKGDFRADLPINEGPHSQQAGKKEGRKDPGVIATCVACPLTYFVSISTQSAPLPTTAHFLSALSARLNNRPSPTSSIITIRKTSSALSWSCILP